MAEIYQNPLSTMSYTNKDFQTVFPELLDLVKKLTYKWDPSISNESDPGVILIKLNAILADKLDYNTDQTVLETFPLSVSQESNARQLFYELGYNMKWYQAATGTVQVKILDTSVISGGYMPIPAFTMLCDQNQEVIYTTLKQIQVSDNSVQNIDVIQGTINDYEVNNNSVVTIRNLDANNRLYFNARNVAENGIFIKNRVPGTIQSDDWDQWSRVDNIYTQPINTKCYQFGITVDGSQCYIEFPDDIDNLIDSGIEIKYITTNGVQGNVGSNVITKFYDNVVLTQAGTTQTQKVTESTAVLYNMLPLQSGSDPETIEDGYKNYKRILGTFNTLVSLRDYMNYLYEDGYTQQVLSNVIVTDRKNDTQTSYVVNEISGDDNHQLVYKQQQNNNNDPMSPFDLKLYATQYTNSDIIQDGATFNVSFIPVTNDGNRGIEEECLDSTNLTDGQQKFTGDGNTKVFIATDLYRALSVKVNGTEQTSGVQFTKNIVIFTTAPADTAEIVIYGYAYSSQNFFYDSKESRSNIERSIKSINHDFIDYEYDKFLWFKAVFPIDAKIFPTQVLQRKEIEDLKFQIQKALYQNLNSHNIGFGEEVTYDMVYNTILNADPRIRQVALNTFDHYMYGVICTQIGAKDYFIDIPLKDGYPQDYSQDYSYTSPTITIYGMKYNAYKVVGGETATAKVNTLRTDILAKCILTGHSPLFIKDTNFNIDLTQNIGDGGGVAPLVNEISSSFELKLATVSDVSSVPTNYYTLQDNEGITLIKPALYVEQNFAGYVKFFTSGDGSDSDIDFKDGETIKLGADQSITFCYKEQSDDTMYKYFKVGTGALLRANFTTGDTSKLYTYNEQNLSGLNDLPVGQGVITDSNLNSAIKKVVNQTKVNGFCTLTGNYQIDKLQVTETTYKNKSLPYCVITNKTIQGDGEDRYEISLNSHTMWYAYNYTTSTSIQTEYTSISKVWSISNNVATQYIKGTDYTVSNGQGGKLIITFTQNPGVNTIYITSGIFDYTLKNGEYFLILDDATNEDGTQQFGLQVLGSGTTIEANNQLTFSNIAVPMEQVVSQGALIFTTYDLPSAQINGDAYITFRENDFITLGNGTTVAVFSDNPNQLNIVSEPTSISAIDFYYTESQGDSLPQLAGWEKVDHVQDPDKDWKVYSYLNVNMSTNSPQVLHILGDYYEDDMVHGAASKDTITLHLDTTPPTDTPLSLDNLNIQSKYPILSPGGSKIDIRHYNVDTGEYESNSIYYYTKFDMPVDDSNGYIKPVVSDGGDSTVDIGVSAGEYIIQFKYNQSGTLIVTDANDNPQEDINGNEYTSTDYDITKDVYYYIDISQENTSSPLTFSFTPDDDQSGDTILTIKQSYKVAQNRFDRTEGLLSKLSSLGGESYDYLYEPPEGELIKDPLSFEGFTDKNHLYNDKYICQMFTKNISDNIGVVQQSR